MAAIAKRGAKQSQEAEAEEKPPGENPAAPSRSALMAAIEKQAAKQRQQAEGAAKPPANKPAAPLGNPSGGVDPPSRLAPAENPMAQLARTIRGRRKSMVASDDDDDDPKSPVAKPKKPAKRPEAKSVLPPAQQRVASLVEGAPNQKPGMGGDLLAAIRDARLKGAKKAPNKPAPKVVEPPADGNANTPGGPSVKERMLDQARAKNGDTSDDDDEWEEAALLDALLGGLMDRSMEAEFATGVAFSCTLDGDTERCERQKEAMQLLAATAYYPLGGEELRHKHPDATSLLDAILRAARDIASS